MARYKPYDLNQTRMIRLSYADQIIEGSFEHALNEVVEKRLDLSVFGPRYENDGTGRPAYDPKVLLKVVLYGYYHGLVSSRRIADACRRNVVFMALSANSRPHFTTIATFVRGLKNEIASLFGDVLTYASELGLIGQEHFAIDGCKLPSNASKKWSGTHKELEDKCDKLERIAECIAERHRERDAQEREDPRASSEPEKVQYYRRKTAAIRVFLEENEKKLGPTGNEQKSNLTDPESAKMATSRGVIQGYNGLTVVDDRAQIVVFAEAHCPAGQKLYRSGKNMLFNGYRVDKFKAPLAGCRGCRLRAQCLRYPDRTRQRQLTVIKHQAGPPPKRRDKCDGPTQRMRWKFDTPFGRALYSRRMGTVEPVFGNLQNKGMRRFTLRSQAKVNAQWKLFTMVHNIEKLASAPTRPCRKSHSQPHGDPAHTVGPC